MSKYTDIEYVFYQQEQDNIYANRPPNEFDDITKGYDIKSTWIDRSVSPSDIYKCADNTENDAVWLNITEDTSSIDELYETDLFILDSNNIINKYITLSYEPQDPDEIIFDIKNAPTQYYGDDFKQDETFRKRITWEGLGLDGVLQENDKIIISYTRSLEYG